MHTAVEHRADLRAGRAVRTVTIMFADIRGFTHLVAEYSLLALVGLLDYYFAEMSALIAKRGGMVDKFIGDSIMALFGAVKRREDDALQAILCAADMQRKMTQINDRALHIGLPPLYIGIGIATGEVIAGPLGTEHHREYTVIGERVNLASRIEARALRGQILIDETTREAVTPYVDACGPHQFQPKGQAAPAMFYELLRVREGRVTRSVDASDSRRTPRARVRIPITFQLVENKHVRPAPLDGEIRDVSYNGFLLASPSDLDVSAEIAIPRFPLLSAGAGQQVYARVIRSTQDEGMRLCNVEFTSLPPATELGIRRLVDHLLDPH